MANLPAGPLGLTALKRVHIIGVCGTLMGAFAAYLKRKGIEVTGSDQNVYPPMSDVLRNAGVQLFSGYRAENLTALNEKPDLVVIGNVIRADNPEARATLEGGYRYSSLPEAMENLFLSATRNLVVAGTHGKTTTSSLLAYTLIHCQKNPNYFIGGVAQDLPFSFQLTSIESGHPFVLEGDEYDTAFWDKVPKFNHYLPDDVILTSVEFDHADIYVDLDAVKKAFSGLISRIRPQGRLIACFDNSDIKELAKKAHVPILSYGLPGNGGRFTVDNIKVQAEGTYFEIRENNKVLDEIMIRIPGVHNALNALAVWIECREMGLDLQQVKQALQLFQGVKRRQEVRGEVGGVIVIDDFAHHPTAVRETLKALKLKYANRRLIAVFEPRSATSRRKVFQKDYASAFQNADSIFIASPFDQSKISSSEQFSSEMLIDDLKAAGKDAVLMATVDEGVESVAQAASSGDVIAVLSNGGFGGFIPKLLDALVE